MLTTLRLYYLNGVRNREQIVGCIKSALCGSVQSFRSAKAAWQESSSMFDRSPLDAIAAERLFEIERNFLKINGYEYPPLRPLHPPFGRIRVEFYSNADKTQLCRSNSDCWADIALLPSGHLDLELLQRYFSFDLTRFAIIDPVRLKPVAFEGDTRISPLAVHNLTYQAQLPLRITEIGVPALAQSKRLLRHYFLTFICMLSAIYNLLWHRRAYDEYEFSYPLPALFLWFYNATRALLPGTRREAEAPDLDVLNSPTGESFIIDLPGIRDTDCSYGKGRIARLFSGPTQSQLWCATIIGYTLFLWMVAAEVVACARA